MTTLCLTEVNISKTRLDEESYEKVRFDPEFCERGFQAVICSFSHTLYVNLQNYPM